MLIRKKNLKELLIEKPKDGKGVLHRWDYIKDLVPCSNICSFSFLELEPDSEIGYHQHVDNFEVYYIISGNGKINDDGKISTVNEGDMIITGKGESHSLYNDAKGKMSLVAFICA